LVNAHVNNSDLRVGAFQFILLDNSGTRSSGKVFEDKQQHLTVGYSASAILYHTHEWTMTL